MASNRHLGRIIALQTLYEQDFRRSSHDTDFDLQAVLERNIARYEATVDDTDFIKQLVEGVAGSEKELDAILQPLAPEWPIGEIARMDRVILRIGAYELTSDHGVPPKVVINEAVELAKAFGSENSSKFINGVLGTLLRKQNGETVMPVTIGSDDSQSAIDDTTASITDVNDAAVADADNNDVDEADDTAISGASNGTDADPQQPSEESKDTL
ncbi:MAG TPA: transcription antitermination factor NusB [Candidatus Saccharimonadales bacterium]|nr:transcription antitermination factor NusB [Candidatus Saccharimonadales bacterium]